MVLTSSAIVSLTVVRRSSVACRRARSDDDEDCEDALGPRKLENMTLYLSMWMVGMSTASNGALSILTIDFSILSSSCSSSRSSSAGTSVGVSTMTLFPAVGVPSLSIGNSLGTVMARANLGLAVCGLLSELVRPLPFDVFFSTTGGSGKFNQSGSCTRSGWSL